jgi:hypothetical protein
MSEAVSTFSSISNLRQFRSADRLSIGGYIVSMFAAATAASSSLIPRVTAQSERKPITDHIAQREIARVLRDFVGPSSASHA